MQSEGRMRDPSQTRFLLPPGEGIFISVVAILLLLVMSPPLHAHDARPLSILIVEQGKSTYRVDMRMPPSIEAPNEPEISFPEGCAVRSGPLRQSTDALVKTMFVSCPSLADGIDGRQIGIHYPLFNPSLSTLLRYSPESGDTRTAVLPPTQTQWQVPKAANWKTVAHDYLLLGIEHIWTGIDHLLFVTGLLLLAKTPRRIAWAVTGFTLAHSLTLSLSTLGIVRLPLLPVEAGIALSILFLAREVARPDSESLARRYPLAISAFFGLLHGFGFAAALRAAGLPRNEIGAALLFFNTGVEVGQLVFIAITLTLIRLVMRVARTTGSATVPLVLSRVEDVCAYGLGIPAAFWFLERLRAFWVMS
jgi:hydrogenase/urease accessory protein HupE